MFDIISLPVKIINVTELLQMKTPGQKNTAQKISWIDF